MQRPEYVPAPDRPAEFPFSPAQLSLAGVVEKLGPARVRHAARHAFQCLRKAWHLHPIDPAMSMFRAITAEEEAATALILALKQQRYPRASDLRHDFHPHKASIWPFMQAISHQLSESQSPSPSVFIATEGRPRIDIEIDFGDILGHSKPYYVKPEEPLDFVLHGDELGPMQVHRFKKGLAAIAETAGKTDFAAHVRDEATFRNRLIYAGEGGMPDVIFQDDLLEQRADRVSAILVVVIAVLQTKRHQTFVIQCIEALLDAIRGLEGEVFSYPELKIEDQPTISIQQQPDGSYWSGIVVRRFILGGPYMLRRLSWPGRDWSGRAKPLIRAKGLPQVEDDGGNFDPHAGQS